MSWYVKSFVFTFFNTTFVSSHMYPKNPEGTQVIVGSMNMGYGTLTSFRLHFKCLQVVLCLTSSFLSVTFGRSLRLMKNHPAVHYNCEWYCISLPCLQANMSACTIGLCKNGGTCLERRNGYICKCSPGFTGQRCETSDYSVTIVHIVLVISQFFQWFLLILVKHSMGSTEWIHNLFFP